MLEADLTGSRELLVEDVISNTTSLVRKLSDENPDSKKKTTTRATWLASFGLRARSDTSSNCHEPHIHHGYRPNPSCFTYCIKSAFHPTNETLNVWTHGLPCLLMTKHYMNFADSHLNDLSDPLLYPYWFMVAGVIFTLLGSTCAHLFNCLSPGTREVCFCCDYGVIALQAIGLTCTFTFYLCPYSCILKHSSYFPSFYIVMMIGNTLSVVTACITRYPNIPHRDCLRVAPYVFMYTMLNIPCIYKYTLFHSEHYTDVEDISSVSPACTFSTSALSFRYYITLTFLMLAGATVQAYKLPERWFPGKFDIVGHSHQIFHLLTAAGLYYQTILIEQSVLEALSTQNSGTLTPEILSITWLTSVFVPTFVGLCCLSVAIYFSLDLYNFHSKKKVQ